MKRPIMLWITSRSRSSLVSSIFIQHGVWWGDTPVQVNGYTSWENQHIKSLLKEFKTKYWKKVHLTPVSPKWNDEFEQKLSKLVPTDKIWMMKTGVEYFNAFKGLDPYNIFIRRPAEDVAKSLANKRPNVVYQDALDAAKWRFEYMDKLRDQFGGVDVDTDRITMGNFEQVKQAVEYCNLTFDEEAVKRAIVR